MVDIINVIEKLENLRHLQPATTTQIDDAEKQLGLLFANEYKQYLEKYGVISAKGLELTGITASSRLNVVEVTKNDREMHNIPNDMYVIENMAIEGIILLQNSIGEIYEIHENRSVNKIYSSLCEYIYNEHLL